LKSNTLHIVALNIPYPTNYGGAIDIFYKIKALSSLGINIHLHCFEYGRKHAEILNSLCKSVTYYPRVMDRKNLLSKTPFIVQSRNSNKLLENLINTDAPILYEGLHCCYYLKHPLLKNRKQFVRAHNIESDYYKLLAKSETKLLNKLYLFTEYLKIKSFQKRLSNADGVFSISDKDQAQLSKSCHSHLIRAFHPDSTILSKTGLGEYAIYHGNLSVAENENAALFLSQKVFKHLNYDLVITGSKPSNKLRKEVLKHSNIRLVENPENSVLEKMIQDAHIQVLPTEQDTGIKLKLLKSLYHGRHCIVNVKMINQTGLEKACAVVESPKQWICKIKELETVPFEAKDINLRTELLKPYNCIVQANKIQSIIFPQE
jgi:hypothetical protein